MSRTDKDLPWRLGGSKHRYWVSHYGHAQFTRQCRRRERHAAHMDIHAGVEPPPRSFGHEYWD